MCYWRFSPELTCSVCILSRRPPDVHTHPEGWGWQPAGVTRNSYSFPPFWRAQRALGNQTTMSWEYKCSWHDMYRLLREGAQIHVHVSKSKMQVETQKWFWKKNIVFHCHVPSFFLMWLQEVIVVCRNIRSKNYKWGQHLKFIPENIHRTPLYCKPRFRSWDHVNEITSSHELTKSSSLG